jgi:hypothetical protein
VPTELPAVPGWSQQKPWLSARNALDACAPGAAAATVLAEAFGRDHVPFSFASPSALPVNPVRSLRSFSEAARENADSRVKAGLHFRFATDAGLELGRRIGQHANRHSLPRQQGAAASDD